MSLSGKVVLITGATAGIGNETATRLVGLGMRVVGCARDYDRLKKFADEMNEKGPGEMLAIKCDLEKEEDISEMFEEIGKKYGTLYALINNAGFSSDEPLLSGFTNVWRSMLNVNVLAPAICGREAVELMRRGGVDDGHIIFINSVAGHRILDIKHQYFYSITKYAITAMAAIFRQELFNEKCKIRSTSISPGMVKTEFLSRALNEDVAKEAHEKLEPLLPEDVTDAIVYVLNSSPRNNIDEITLTPTAIHQ